MNSLKPMLLTCLKSYDKSQFIKDVTAGIIVAIIALPLSIALALASGVGPEAGIFTAIVAGFVISALGGSCICNQRSRYRSTRLNGRTYHRHYNGGYISYPDGTVPLRQSD